MTRTEILRQAIQEMPGPKYGSLTRAAAKAHVTPSSLSKALRSSSGPSVGLSVRLAKAWGLSRGDILEILGIQTCFYCYGAGQRLVFIDSGWAVKMDQCPECEGKAWLNFPEKDID